MFDVQLIGGALGAEVRGVDLSIPPEPATIDTMRELLHEHLVLFFPDQHGLDDPSQLALMQHFGEGYIHPLAVVAGATEAKASRIIDDADHPPFQNEWHTDVSWDTSPPTIGSLRAVDMPERGGDTLFASTRHAYDTLSSDLRDRLHGLTARHGIGFGNAFRSKAGAELTERAAATMPDTRHPVVATHPVTGRSHLYVNRSFTEAIVELDADESAALLAELYDHMEQTDWCIRHRWSVGTFCMWDERATLHYAAADHFPARREMCRVVVR